MANAEPNYQKPSPIQALDLHCGICNAVVDKPKVLPCLHMFCLTCLLHWSETAAEKDPSKYVKVISCPSCHEDFPLPEGGVYELETNAFVENLKERKSIQESLNEKGKISCTSCEDDAQAVGHCQDCGEFLCENCLQSHKRLRKFKDHMVSLLEELTEGSPFFPKHDVCSKHTGEVLKFYCETCERPVCRDCIVIEHPAPDHKQIDIDTAVQKRKTLLETLQQESEDIPEAIDAAISEDEKLLIALDANVELVLDQFKKTVTISEREFARTTQEFQASRNLEIESHKATLQNQKSRASATLEMAKEVIQNGIGSDLGMTYASLCKAMATLNDLRPNGLSPSVSDVDFLPNKDLIKGLGTLSGYKSWKLAKNIQCDSWEFKNPTSITYNSSDDIIVTLHRSYTSDTLVEAGNSAKPSKFDKLITTAETHLEGLHQKNSTLAEARSSTKTRKFDQFITSAESLLKMLHRNTQSGVDIAILGDDGSVKNEFTTQSNPWGVATGQDGSIYVTDDSRFIKVYDVHAKLQRQIDMNRDHFGNGLRGIASDTKGVLFVGHTSGYIDSVFENGGLILNFLTEKYCSPDFIATTSEGDLIYSLAKDAKGAESARVLIHKSISVVGDFFVGREFALHPPSSLDITNFKPTGVCVHEGHQVIFVANAGDAPGIYCYSLTGDYLGIVTTEVTSPQGIALRGDEQELAVCDGTEIKLFHPQ